MNKSTKIGVLGIGAIGSVITATLLIQKNVDLYCYNRSPKNEIKLLFNNQDLVFPISIETKITQVVHLDWLIICLKEYHYPLAKDLLSALIQPSTKIAIIRNGIRLKDHLLPFSPNAHLLECMIDCPTQATDNGFYIQYRSPILTIPKSELAQEFHELFQSNNITILQVTDFKTANWKKIIESASLGGILCLTGETCWIFKDKKLVALYEQLVDESIQVAIADGANIEMTFKSELLNKLLSYPPTKGSSMLTDRINGNPIELNAKNGIISTIAKELNIATPINDMITHLLKFTNSGKRLDFGILGNS